MAGDKDITQEVITHICDKLCRHAADPTITQDELDSLCDGCVMNGITRIEGVMFDEQ